MKSARWRKAKSLLFCDEGESKIQHQNKTWITLSPTALATTEEEGEKVEARTESEEVERKDENKVKQK